MTDVVQKSGFADVFGQTARRYTLWQTYVTGFTDMVLSFTHVGEYFYSLYMCDYKTRPLPGGCPVPDSMGDALCTTFGSCDTTRTIQVGLAIEGQVNRSLPCANRGPGPGIVFWSVFYHCPEGPRFGSRSGADHMHPRSQRLCHDPLPMGYTALFRGHATQGIPKRGSCRPDGVDA